MGGCLVLALLGCRLAKALKLHRHSQPCVECPCRAPFGSAVAEGGRERQLFSATFLQAWRRAYKHHIKGELHAEEDLQHIITEPHNASRFAGCSKSDMSVPISEAAAGDIEDQAGPPGLAPPEVDVLCRRAVVLQAFWRRRRLQQPLAHLFCCRRRGPDQHLSCVL